MQDRYQKSFITLARWREFTKSRRTASSDSVLRLRPHPCAAKLQGGASFEPHLIRDNRCTHFRCIASTIFSSNLVS